MDEHGYLRKGEDVPSDHPSRQWDCPIILPAVPKGKTEWVCGGCGLPLYRSGNTSREHAKLRHKDRVARHAPTPVRRTEYAAYIAKGNSNGCWSHSDGTPT
jgi:hypothetical protein